MSKTKNDDPISDSSNKYCKDFFSSSSSRLLFSNFRKSFSASSKIPLSINQAACVCKVNVSSLSLVISSIRLVKST